MQPFKKVFLLLIAAVLALFSPYPLRANHDETIDINIREIPYREPEATFVSLGFEFSGQQKIEDKASLLSQKGSLLGFSLASFSTRPGDIQSEFRLGYRRLKADQIGYGLKDLSDFSCHFGGRYYPHRPTFGLGKIPIRFTFSALGGVDWLPAGDWKDTFAFSVVLSGGLSISSGDSPSGFLIEFVYRPISTNMKLKDSNGVLWGTLLLKPSWCIRIAWLFAP